METKEKPPSPLEMHLGYWLRLVSNHVSAAFADKLWEKAKIAVAEWVVLRMLYDGPHAPSRLAERMGLTRGAITKLAGKLIKRRLISRAADAEDGRAQILSVTARGRELVLELAVLADRNDSEFFDQLPVRERQALKHLLLKIVSVRGLRGMPTE